MSEPQPPYGATPQHPAPAQPHGAPPQFGAAAPYGASAANGTIPGYQAPTAGTALGRTAFLIAVISVGAGTLSVLLFPFLFSSGHYDIAAAATTIIALIVLLGAAVALVLGLIALRRPEPRLLAAIAVGLAGSAVISRLLGWASSVVYSTIGSGWMPF